MMVWKLMTRYHTQVVLMWQPVRRGPRPMGRVATSSPSTG